MSYATMVAELTSRIGVPGRYPVVLHPAEWVDLAREYIPWWMRLWWTLAEPKWRKFTRLRRAERRRR